MCEVRKSIYGMAQAGRRWQRTIYPWLLDPKQGFTQLHSDPNVFIKQHRAVRPSSWAATLTISLHFTLTLALALCATSSLTLSKSALTSRTRARSLISLTWRLRVRVTRAEADRLHRAYD